MKKWFKQLNISTGLQFCFMLSAFLSLFVGIVGLYTWEQQRNEISIAIDNDFPKVQAAFQVEEQINLLQNAFLELNSVNNVSERLDWKIKTEMKLTALKKIIMELQSDVEPELFSILSQLSLILEQLSNGLEKRLESNDNFKRILTKINWLHDDFHNEFTALLQEMSWQQSTLINNIQVNNIPNNQAEANAFSELKKLQQELQLVYGLVTYEDQIVSELKNQIISYQIHSDKMQQNYLAYLSVLVDDKIKKLDIQSSTYTIKQIIDELITIGLDDSQLPHQLEKRRALNAEQQKLIGQKDELVSELKNKVRKQVGNSQKQLSMIQNIVEKSTHISGRIILISMIIAFILVILVNFFYIRLRLLKRFQLLNQAVDRLNNGESNVKIPIHGADELGRIANLLRSFLYEMNKQNRELAENNAILINEINDRLRIQQELETTQHELIQAAKLAVVGQTLSSISHEINQPLNAMNTYLFSAKKALANHNIDAALGYCNKISYLIDRSALIIKRLRQFSRKGSGNLQAISLPDCITNAWNLLEFKYRPLNAQIIIPDNLPTVLGEEVLLQQVFVNLFLNSLEAKSNENPIISIYVDDETNNTITLHISDNGKGWPLTANLLEPFSTNKSINLGLGLSISASIIKQSDGEFYIASTLDEHALIILTLRKANNV